MSRFLSRFLTLVLAIGLVAVGFEAFRFFSAGPGRADEELVFEVPVGTPFARVANNLEQKGLIRNGFELRVLAKLSGQDVRVKHGEYMMNRAMTPQEVLSVLVSGKSILYPVTFPEGSNIFEMAKILEDKGIYKAEAFLKAVRDPGLIKDLLGVEVSSLEGYLFPETYSVTKYTPLKEFIASMVQNFKNVYATLEAHAKIPLQLTRHELVTIASVVEKETGAPEERPMIASVFFNRLLKNMKLQSDPTILYGIWVDTGNFKENITRADIEKPTRYNTYTVPRLPFGPISNPGRESLAAVLNPPTTEMFYFVSRGDGTQVFSKTYEEHLKAVQAFQLNSAAREGKSWRDLKKRTSDATK